MVRSSLVTRAFTLVPVMLCLCSLHGNAQQKKTSASTTGSGAQKKVIASLPRPSSPKQRALELTAPQFNNEPTAMMGMALGANAPLWLDQHRAYAELPAFAPEIENFDPVNLHALTIQDLQKPLPPGDYSVQVLAFCTQSSIHQPGEGLPYKLAPVEGKQASAVSALIVRGVMRQLSPTLINAEAWRIESGLPLSQWPQADRLLIHQLMPEFEASLEDDPFGLGSSRLDALFPKLAQQRRILADKTLTAERLSDHLYEPAGDGFGLTLPPEDGTTRSPWMKLGNLPGVYARFTVVGGNLKADNVFEFRVTEAALRPQNTVTTADGLSNLGWGVVQDGANTSQGPSLAEVLGLGNPIGSGASLEIAYPIGRGAQALIPVPYLPVDPQ